MSDHTKIEWTGHTDRGLNTPTRPALRWFGGKWKLAPWILAHFPQHRTYVEPFGGAASVLLRKPRSYAEVYNDLDDWAVNLFRVLRDEATASRLIAQLRLTPFARYEFDAVREIGEAIGDPVELARRLIIRSFMGFGCNAHNGRSTGFRANTSRLGTTPAEDWANYPDALPALVERLRGVIIEHRDAIAVMAAPDGVASSGERILLHAILYATDFAWLADELAEGRVWVRMDRVSGKWRDAVAACILQRGNEHE